MFAKMVKRTMLHGAQRGLGLPNDDLRATVAATGEGAVLSLDRDGEDLP